MIEESGSGRPKNIGILRIRIRNTGTYLQGGTVSDLRGGLERERVWALLGGLLNTGQLGRPEGPAKLMAIRAATAWCNHVAEDFRCLQV
jgi:hypothetical protein